MARNTTSSSFPFLSLPAEIRRNVYFEILSKQYLILGDRLTNPGFWCEDRFFSLCTRFRYLCLLNPLTYIDNIISLLLTCKQIQAELQALLTYNAPTQLVFSKNLHKRPEESIEVLDSLGIPFNAITQLTFNAVSLKRNNHGPRQCPHLRVLRCGFSALQQQREDEMEEFPKDPERLPNLDNISYMHCLFRSLPALRKLHIYDSLKYSFTHPLPPCSCPLAGTSNCACGWCRCDCQFYLPLPTITNSDPTQVQEVMYNFFEARFRAALPQQGNCNIRQVPDSDSYMHGSKRSSNYFALLDLLAHGVNIYLHEETELAIPSTPLELPSTPKLSSPSTSATAPSEKNICKPGWSRSVWRATYHLAPPHTAVSPAQPVTQMVETPGQRRKRMEAERTSNQIVSAATQRRKTPQKSDQYWRHDSEPREFPRRVNIAPLIEFEAGLDVYRIDEKMAERDRHWKWDPPRPNFAANAGTGFTEYGEVQIPLTADEHDWNALLGTESSRVPN